MKLNKQEIRETGLLEHIRKIKPLRKRGKSPQIKTQFKSGNRNFSDVTESTKMVFSNDGMTPKNRGKLPMLENLVE